MSVYIVVTDDESNADSMVEIPLESDGLLLVTTLEAQYSDATGLKFRAESGAFRGLRVAEGKIHPPDGGWNTASHYIVVCKDSAKRKADDSADDHPPAKAACVPTIDPGDCDLIVLGLAWKTTSQSLQQYFGQYGSLRICQVVNNNATGQSKGFGFIRYVDPDVNRKVLATQFHYIDGRRCEVRVPQRKGVKDTPRKLFVGCLTNTITKDDILAYFAQFGVVTDVFLPSPFRGIAFVTFLESSVAQQVLDQGSHVLNGTQINVSTPQPRKAPQSSGGAGTGQAASAQAQAAMNALTSQALLQQLALGQFGGLAGLQAAGLQAAGLQGALGAGLGATGAAASATQGVDAGTNSVAYAGQSAVGQPQFKW